MLDKLAVQWSKGGETRRRTINAATERALERRKCTTILHAWQIMAIQTEVYANFVHVPQRAIADQMQIQLNASEIEIYSSELAHSTDAVKCIQQSYDRISIPKVGI